MLLTYIHRTLQQQIIIRAFNLEPDYDSSRSEYSQVSSHSQLISADDGDDINQSHQTTLQAGSQ